jgi:hypothetical protein
VFEFSLRRVDFGVEGGVHVRYDNERGKGDHRHIGEAEEEYRFTTIDQTNCWTTSKATLQTGGDA